MSTLMQSKIYKCYLHYSDGLTKNLKLSKQDFDETFEVWKDGIDNGELVYLKIRILNGEKK